MKTKNHHADTHAIAYKEGDEEHWLETHHTEGRANYFCDTINDHEKNNGRDAKFYVVRCDGTL